MKNEVSKRVYVFEESSRRRDIFERYLSERGYDPVVFSGLSYFTEGALAERASLATERCL